MPDPGKSATGEYVKAPGGSAKSSDSGQSIYKEEATLSKLRPLGHSGGTAPATNPTLGPEKVDQLKKG